MTTTTPSKAGGRFTYTGLIDPNGRKTVVLDAPCPDGFQPVLVTPRPGDAVISVSEARPICEVEVISKVDRTLGFALLLVPTSLVKAAMFPWRQAGAAIADTLTAWFGKKV